MRPIICDKCERIINGEEEVRYLGISKFIEENGERIEKPAMQTLELCGICSDKLTKLIQEV